MPQVTTVIPTYRRPALLERAIRSAQAQSLRDIRICVYDNASGDETEDVVRRLADEDSRVVYHRHEQNIGLLGNYNYGMRDVRTPYFSFLADDDILCPRFYEEAVQQLEAHPDAFFFAGRTLIDNRIVRVRQLAGRSWPAGRYEPEAKTVLHMIGEHFIGTSCVFRKSILDSVGAFEASASDRNFVIAASARHPFLVTESIGVVLTIHPRSFSGGGISDEESPIVLDAEYVLALHEELEARLERNGVLAWPEGSKIRAALWRKYRSDIWWAIMTKLFPARRGGGILRLVAERKRYRFSVAEAWLLRVIDVVTRLRPLHRVAVWSLARAHRALLARGEEDVPEVPELRP
jgi:glycosyltransferase involved in cell wall biosynthesis